MSVKGIFAVVVAAGRGTRLGAGAPKAFVGLAGKPMFLHSLATIVSHPSIEAACLVVPAELVECATRSVADAGLATLPAVAAGGAERWHSVRNGVHRAPQTCQWILIHDAARPFVTHAVIDALLEKSGAYRAVITATPVVDTIRRFDGDRAGETVDRHTLVRVGTPQLFRRDDLEQAFALAGTMASPPTDEAVLVQQIGVDVGIAAGDEMNFKITSQADLGLAEMLAARKRAPGGPSTL